MRSSHSPELYLFENSVLQPPLFVGRSKKHVIPYLDGQQFCFNSASVSLHLSLCLLPIFSGCWKNKQTNKTTKYGYFPVQFLTLSLLVLRFGELGKVSVVTKLCLPEYLMELVSRDRTMLQYK